jgi:hypothetical protein
MPPGAERPFGSRLIVSASVTFHYAISGTAAHGQTWNVSGTVEVEAIRPRELGRALEAAMRESFDQLTHGRAVYGSPGLGCAGPYQILELTLTRMP